MSAPAIPVTNAPARPRAARAPAIAWPLDLVNQVMKGLASLKLTVVLMAFGIFVVFIGTLAQTQADIWQVVRDYFHAWIMWVDVNLLFPKSFFPSMPHIALPLIPLPGGMTVGVLMVINLLAAHGWRFKIQASGTRLLAGLAVILAGLAVAVLIIWAGHNTQGFQSKPPFSWDSFWQWFLFAGFVTWLALAAAYGFYGIAGALQKKSVSLVEGVILGLIAVPLAATAGLLGWGFLAARPSDEAIRIVWQLLQGGLAGAILLVGCILVFRKRGGIVLLHAGIGLLFFNELFVAINARERQVFLQEGQTTNYLRDIRTTELAIIDRSAKETDDHVVIPRSLLAKNAVANARERRKLMNTPEVEKEVKRLVEERNLTSAELAKDDAKFDALIDEAIRAAVDPKDQNTIYIDHALLPMRVAVIDYFTNADVRDLAPGEKSPATAGRGLKEVIEELPVAKGTDMGGGVDLAAAYVKFADKKTGKDLGTYLLSQLASEQKNPDRFAEKVTLDGKTYHLFLRFEHDYKPYTIALTDVRKDDYVASDTPRNYSSDIVIKDEAAGIEQPVHIKMNDPLRYRGDTFYQSGYHGPGVTGGAEATTLQVVLNRGWMIPYVACMAVVLGMIAHFLITVTRFISRRETEEIAAGEIITAEAADEPPTDPRTRRGTGPPLTRKPAEPRFSWSFLILPAITACVFLLYVSSAARLPKAKRGEPDLYRFGQLPVAHLGRVKPIDTLARNTVRAISGNGRETVKIDGGKRISAVQWLLEVAAGTQASTNFKVIRIDSKEVRRLFDLPERKGFMYSVAELKPQIARFEKAVDAARKLRAEDLTTEQRRILELDEALKQYITLVRAFSPPDLPRAPSREQVDANPALGTQYLQDFRIAVSRAVEESRMTKAPQVIPVEFGETKAPEDVWRPYPVAWALAYMQHSILGTDPAPTTLAFEEILSGYRQHAEGGGSASAFNSAVVRYEAELRKAAPPLWTEQKNHLESYYNEFSPIYVGIALYVLAFLLAIFGWLFRYKPLNWAAFTMILLTFLLHAGVLVARMYISGRPPVTNLYSSALFIGWAAVLFGLVIEAIFRIGLGNIAAAVMGYATLQVAYFLGAGGDDNIGVMQAVLDTQFWLATHVVCITLGYAATYLAGLFGLLYVIFGLCTPLLNDRSRKELGRMIYGITCFALLFSFYGTVLGGLWADDSWGRFWGWDPKENGALIIVLWNALVLHARWDKMIADRGLAVLSIGGNIVTSWSWFGVNELGIGLHSYGFTEGVLLALGLFVFSQLAIAGLGCLPKSLWWSVQADADRFGPQAA
jgi:ABC-type transport system involved in cytochrome c biogenesis permease subunit